MQACGDRNFVHNVLEKRFPCIRAVVRRNAELVANEEAFHLERKRQMKRLLLVVLDNRLALLVSYPNTYLQLLRQLGVVHDKGVVVDVPLIPKSASTAIITPVDTDSASPSKVTP